MFMNTTINPSTKISSEFAKQLINSKINIKWCDCANFKNMTTELLDLLKESGCVKLVFGFETASKFLQEKINKKISLSHAEKIIKHSYKIGIWIDITLLCGLPYETYEDLYLTLCFIKKNYKYLRGINLNRFIMKMNDYYFHQEKYKLKIFKINNNPYTTLGFDELEGNKWKNKWQFTEDVYQEIIKSLDPIRVNYLRPVNQIFRIFSNDISINRLNDYIDNKILNQNTSKLDLLIKKYKNLSNK